MHETQQIALARVHLAQGDSAKTLDTLNSILLQAESTGRFAHLIDIHILKALAYSASGEAVEAVKCLETAITFATPEGYIQIFVEYGEPLMHLLQEAAECNPSNIHVKKVLSAFDSQSQIHLPEPKSIDSELLSIPARFEPLTDRELEVLYLMAEGLTYNEIASQIMVSLNTVRTHIKNIYSKLFVHRRSQAIAKARELNIL